MLASMKAMEVVTNNLANAETTGYKQERLAMASFGSQLVSRLGDGQDPQAARRLGGMATFVLPEAPEMDLSQGPVQQTGRALDVALQGPGFLVVQAPDGVHYTRGGSFTRDAQGLLMTSTGETIMGESGPLQLPEGRLSIDPDGAVSVDDEPVGRLLVVEFPPDQVLEKIGNNQLVPQGDGAPLAATQTSVLQGAVEASNVDVTAMLTTALELQRAYEASQRMIQYQDEMTSRAVNDVAKPTV
jgi:flagellar basal-body rod protein FlgG